MRDDLPRITIAATAVALLGLTLVLQFANGAFSREFGLEAASHAVSGLLIHDSLATQPKLTILASMREFFSHYPLIGIGRWPPLWYFVEGVWMLGAPASRASLLFLIALTTAGTATILATLAARRFGLLAGFVAGGMFIGCNIVQEVTADVLLDGVVALMCMTALLAFAAYIRSERASDSVLFGLCTGLAMLVKVNGGLLVLVPPLVLIITGRWEFLRRASFWVPIPMVVGVAAPWFVMTYGLGAVKLQGGWGFGYTLHAIVAYTGYLLTAVGPLVIAAGAGGLAMTVVVPRLREDSVLVSAAALLIATWLFHIVVPDIVQPGALVPLLPPLLLLMLAPMDEIAERFPDQDTFARRAVSLVLLASMLPFMPFTSLYPLHGYRAAAAEIWKRRNPSNPTVLIASQHEGSAIAELAFTDANRPSLFAIRGSRLLGGTGTGHDAVPLWFDTPAKAMQAIDSYAIPLVLLQRSGTPGEWPYLHELAEAHELFANRWQLVWEDRSVVPPLQLFALRGNAERPADLPSLRRLTAPRALRD